MTDLVFPPSFLWGTATAAHQVEGGNDDSDWWDWEQRPDTPCVDRSGVACDHYRRYPEDVAMLAGLGFNAYRYSVEWARIEPEEGAFAQGELDHYRRMTDAVREAGVDADGDAPPLHPPPLARGPRRMDGPRHPGPLRPLLRDRGPGARGPRRLVLHDQRAGGRGVRRVPRGPGLPTGHARRGVVGAGDRGADRRPPARPAHGEGGASERRGSAPPTPCRNGKRTRAAAR